MPTQQLLWRDPGSGKAEVVLFRVITGNRTLELEASSSSIRRVAGSRSARRSRIQVPLGSITDLEEPTCATTAKRLPEERDWSPPATPRSGSTICGLSRTAIASGDNRHRRRRRFWRHTV